MPPLLLPLPYLNHQQVEFLPKTLTVFHHTPLSHILELCARQLTTTRLTEIPTTKQRQ
uniref:Uncharacterized protein n=1 Tax=Ciona intestinalis TaxID=7719 RepID=F6UIR3_CIOIN